MVHRGARSRTLLPVRVLICDDEPHVRLVYRAAFEDCGADVIEAVDGDDCLEQLAAGLPRPRDPRPLHARPRRPVGPPGAAAAVLDGAACSSSASTTPPRSSSGVASGERPPASTRSASRRASRASSSTTAPPEHDGGHETGRSRALSTAPVPSPGGGEDVGPAVLGEADLEEGLLALELAPPLSSMVAVPVKVWVTTLSGSCTWWPQTSPTLLSNVSALRRCPRRTRRRCRSRTRRGRHRVVVGLDGGGQRRR